MSNPLYLEDGTSRLSIRQAKREGAYIVYWVSPNDQNEYPTHANGGWSSFKQLRTLEKAFGYALGLKGGATVERILCLPDKKRSEYPLKQRWSILTWVVPPRATKEVTHE